MTGRWAVPTTSRPVSSRVASPGFGVPSSSWFAMDPIASIVSVEVTEWSSGPARVTA